MLVQAINDQFIIPLKKNKAQIYIASATSDVKKGTGKLTEQFCSVIFMCRRNIILVER